MNVVCQYSEDCWDHPRCKYYFIVMYIIYYEHIIVIGTSVLRLGYIFGGFEKHSRVRIYKNNHKNKVMSPPKGQRRPGSQHWLAFLFTGWACPFRV